MALCLGKDTLGNQAIVERSPKIFPWCVTVTVPMVKICASWNIAGSSSILWASLRTCGVHSSSNLRSSSTLTVLQSYIAPLPSFGSH